MVQLNSFPLGFTADFIRSQKGKKCYGGNDTQILNKFVPLSEGTNDMDIARTRCEDFCSFQNRCWGCSVFCAPNCTWNAVTHCRIRGNWEGKKEHRISQKPGNMT